MIPGNKILLFFTPWKKVTFFHGKILKPISDVKFVNIANLSITNFCGIWKFLILSSLQVYFKCLFRRSWGSEIKSNYKFNGNKFALFHSYLVFTRRPPPPAGSWKQVTREIKRYFIAIEYIVILHTSAKKFLLADLWSKNFLFNIFSTSVLNKTYTGCPR